MFRSVRRAALASLVALTAGCSNGTPSTAGARLVGTWEHDLRRDESFTRLATQNGVEFDTLIARVAKEGPPLRMTFAANGTYVMEGSVLGRPTHDEYTWSVTDEHADRITIGIHAPGKPTETVTYVFTEPGVIRSEDRLTGTMFMQRAK